MQKKGNKNLIIVFLIFNVLFLSSCSSPKSSSKIKNFKTKQSTNKELNMDTSKKESTKSNQKDYNKNEITESTMSIKENTEFTNKYGTPDTKCVVADCNEYIASSGDTNCCVKHSNKCLNCNTYIDGDATFCIPCLTSSVNNTKKESQSNLNSNTEFTNKYGTPNTKCAIIGCTKNIAPSGDTNCCIEHSNRCLNCNTYIDGDATFCMSCLLGN